MAVSHRARNDPGYRSAYVGYMAEAATVRAFDPASQALEAEMRQRVMGLRYSGNMMSPTVAPDSFWPMADTWSGRSRPAGLSTALPGSPNLTPTTPGTSPASSPGRAFARAGWACSRPMRPTQLLDRAGLANEYVAVAAENGQPRQCGGCGAGFSALAGAKAIICEGCGRKMDLGSAEIPCAACGAVMTLPAGADRVACPFCQAQVERAGIR